MGCLCPMLCKEHGDHYCQYCMNGAPETTVMIGSTNNVNPSTEVLTEEVGNPTTKVITENNVSADDGNPTTEDPTEDNSSTDNANPTNNAVTTNDGNPITDATIDGNTNHIKKDNSTVQIIES